MSPGKAPGDIFNHLYLSYTSYINCANIDAPTTVSNPDTTIDRLLIAPSISPISIALEVPIAWDAVPIAIPLAIGS